MMVIRGLKPRQWGLGLAMVTLIAFVLVLRYMLIPAGREWMAKRAQLSSKSAEHARLVRNLALKKGVDEAFAQLGPQVYQQESDAMTLAAWLRELEVMARGPSMSLDNMKAMPVKHEEAYRVYRVRLSVSGKLPEVLKFVTKATNGEAVAGIESFSLRGVQGVNMVECGLVLRMIRLVAEQGAPGGLAGGSGNKTEAENGE